MEIEAAAIALIGGRGSCVAIAQHPVARRQGRADAALHVLGAIGGIEQQLGGGARRGGGRRLEQQLAQGQAQGRTARFAGDDQLGARRQQATAGQPGGQGPQLGGLATAIDALQHQEASPGGELSRGLKRLATHFGATGH